MPRLVRLAILFSFLSHGALILAARYRASYDAYVHMFFADHYRMDWWSLWDDRWYTGFPVTSYPPLVHQLMAALSHAVGLDAAFGLVLWITATGLPLAVYCFARVFVGRAAAGYAALGSAFLPSVYLTGHIFGQLPFLFGTVLALFGAASLARYLEQGGLHNFALTVAITATTMSAHHAVLLLQPFLVFAVVTRGLSTHIENRSKISPVVLRLILFAIFAVGLSLLVMFPFWEWGRSQSIQTPIDHASRHNFFQKPLAPLLFFLPMYGPLMAILPAAFFLVRKRPFTGLGISLFILFLLGLGGTTPLPRLLFGRGWEWLTYDRFAFWATLLLLPFFGMILILRRRRHSKDFRVKVFSALGVSSLIVALVTAVLPLQPGAVDMDQVVEFLEQDERSRWRYVTFGFGDQLALLSRLTTATTIDGSYHTARSLPELRSSGIAQIDTAFWFPDGLEALDPILQKSGDRGVRWGFVNTPQYIPVLERNGWIKLTALRNGVQVWENPVAIMPTPSSPPPVSRVASFAWGTLPMLCLIAAVSLASLRMYPLQAENALRAVYAFLVGLMPFALFFWYFRIVGEFPHPRVYFTYDHALFFLSDALAVVAVLLWVAVRIARSHQPQTAWSSSIHVPLLAIVLLSIASILWSSDWRTSLYICIHLLLVFLLILSLSEWYQAWRPVMIGFCAALTIQVAAGFAAFAAQTSSFLLPLEMTWPGLLDPSVRGSSVVQLENGLRVLRAYGTLPHPNILGGFALVCLLGPAAFVSMNRRINLPALFLYALGIILMMITFSRSAWLGLMAFLFILLLKRRHLEKKSLFLLTATSVLTIIFTALPLQDLVLTRVSNAPVQTEQLSIFSRSWLNQQAVKTFQTNTVGGVGIGSFVLELADHAVEGAIIEPVHSIILLTAAELGIFGLIGIIGLSIGAAKKIAETIRPQAILASATLAGVAVIGLFDHYFWSIAPGRLMLGLVLGLWAGQVLRDDT